MTKKTYSKISTEFNIKEFVETNNSSAKRSRWITIVLVVATVVIFIGFYNSMQTSWAVYRLTALKDFENVPENNAGKIDVKIKNEAQQQKPLLDAYFGEDDFIDFGKFACKFESKNFPESLNLNKVPHYLYDSLNEKTKQLLTIECDAIEKSEKSKVILSKDLIKLVKDDLNRVLKDRFLYSAERFPSDVLKEEHRAKNFIRILTEESGSISNTNSVNYSKRGDSIWKLSETDLIRFNRSLLEAVYDGEIFKSSNLIPSMERQISKEIASRMAFDEHILFIKIPFFDIPIDINDLGLIGGLSLIIILSLQRFSFSREIKNLNLSFKEAFYHEKLCQFYHLLAMRQVLTIPETQGEMDNETKNSRLVKAAKGIFWLPFLVILFGAIYDLISVLYYKLFEWETVVYQLFIQFFPSLLVVGFLSYKCLQSYNKIEKLWQDYYKILPFTPDTLSEAIKIENPDKDLVEIAKCCLGIEIEKLSNNSTNSSEELSKAIEEKKENGENKEERTDKD